nr:transposase [Sinorhizobium meliloti]
MTDRKHADGPGFRWIGGYWSPRGAPHGGRHLGGRADRTEFLRKLTRRSLKGVKLAVSDAHEGLKAAATKVLCATWQRCRAGPLHAQRSCPRLQEPPACRLRLHRHFARETLEPPALKGAPSPTRSGRRSPSSPPLMDDAEEDVLAYMTFPKEHRAKLHSTNPIARLNGEIKRRTEVVGISSNDDAIVRLVGGILLEQNDEWAVQRARYMTPETISQMSDDPLISMPAVAR